MIVKGKGSTTLRLFLATSNQTAVTAGADGLISVHDLAGGQSTTIKPSSSYVSYNAVRWTTPHTFVTVRDVYASGFVCILSVLQGYRKQSRMDSFHRFHWNGGSE